MGCLSKISKTCQTCQSAKECTKKRMEAVRCLPESIKLNTASPSSADLTQPILRETVNTIINGEVVKIYKDDLEKELYKSLYSQLGLNYGGK